MRYPDSGGVSAKQRTEREHIRFEAAKLLEQGMIPSEIARLLRVSPKSVYTWRRRIQAGGLDNLRSTGPGGAKCQLSEEQLGWLRADLDLGPAAFGWTDDQRWTAARVADLVFERFGIRYTDRGMDYLLRRMGYTPQVPVRKAERHSQEAIDTWVDEVWPQVKAPRRPSGPGSSSRTSPARA